MTIAEVITELNSNDAEGMQLSKRNGMIFSTWLVYQRDGFFYYFDINQKIEFVDRYKYTETELIEYFEGSVFVIDLFL